MAKKLNYADMAVAIITQLGTQENLTNVNHCATRLRVVVRDPSRVDAAALKKIDGVLGVEVRENQVQVIVGQIIEDLFLEVEKRVGKTSAGGAGKPQEKKLVAVFSNFLQLMAGIMSPVIPSLIAAGFLTCLLLLLNLVFGLESTNSTYVILNNLAQSVFYFLPVFVAYTSAKKFDTEPVLAMLLACWLLYPDWVAMAGAGGYTSYFGIPALLTTYNGAVLQIILSVWVMSKIDQLLKKVLPLSVRHFLKPFLLILITSIITLTLTGPLGGLVTNYIAMFIAWIRNYASWAAVPAIIIFASTIGLLCPGFHLALIPIATTSLATVGYDDFINIWFFCCTITPGFIALAVALKSKNRRLKEIAFPASISALFGGISEPTTYGISYKMPKVYFCSIATSLITGLYAGIVHLKCFGFGGYSLTNILLYLGENGDMTNFIKALIGVGIMAVCSFVFVFMTKWDDSVYNEEDSEAENTAAVLTSVELTAPAQGVYIAQQNIADPVFAAGTLGACFGIRPETDEVLSPVDGVINSIAPTRHAMTIKTAGGAEVMVHIGIDSMKLGDHEIETLVQTGQAVNRHQPIAKIDRKAFAAKQLDDTIIVILLNSAAYTQVHVDDQRQQLIAAA
ncbi:PTS glucose transporter subunit IIA [Holdemania filiformis]|uniref:PTS glucose transporter subunit IIA n=1 Tax=Holdemania filiformis TaxID=61171 RepID=UPI00266EFF53|nr:PTS glucose transporter subunit IIA [Holdemania filiformis]